MPNDESKQLEAIPCHTDRFQPAWNLTITSFKVREVTPTSDAPFVELVFTFGFSHDVDDIAVLRSAFQPFAAASQSDFQTRGEFVAFYLFDEENVVLAKTDVARIEGAEITGKAGDAFRVVVRCSPESYAQARKVEPRLVR